MKTSFAPRDFGSGRWEGGAATITDPHFEYRDADFGQGPEKLVTLSLTYMDNDGAEHAARFDVGNTATRAGEQILVVRASADDDAEEAELGPAFSHIDPTRVYKISPKSEFGAFIMSLTTVAGFSEAKLEGGDITVLDGLEVIVTPKARKEGDKWPLLVVTALQKGSGTSTSASKPTASAARKPAASKAAPEESEEDAELTPNEEAARDFVLALDKPVGIGKAVSLAMSEFKADKKQSASIVKLLQDEEFHGKFTDFWTYDKKKKSINAA